MSGPGGLQGANAPFSVETVDYHTAGEPFRIVIGGPKLRGTTVLERRRHARDHHDRIRQLVVNEPRGHADMYGCFVTEPNDPAADFGVVFFHNAGYSTACGHGTIALATWAIDSGLVPATEPQTTITIDVPSGRLTATARVSKGTVHSVRFTNVPAYVEQLDVPILAAGRPAQADVAFGGAFYASVDTRALGLPVMSEQLPQFIALGREIKAQLETRWTYEHALECELTGIYGVIFFEPKPPRDGVLCQRNVTVFADGEVDRSPCGSGTSARLAILHACGTLQEGGRLLHEGIVDTTFDSRIAATTQVARRPAVITEVEGSAYRTGMHTFVLDPDDPLGTGFILR